MVSAAPIPPTVRGCGAWRTVSPPWTGACASRAGPAPGRRCTRRSRAPSERACLHGLDDAQDDAAPGMLGRIEHDGQLLFAQLFGVFDHHDEGLGAAARVVDRVAHFLGLAR